MRQSESGRQRQYFDQRQNFDQWQYVDVRTSTINNNNRTFHHVSLATEELTQFVWYVCMVYSYGMYGMYLRYVVMVCMVFYCMERRVSVSESASLTASASLQRRLRVFAFLSTGHVSALCWWPVPQNDCSKEGTAYVQRT